MELLHTHLTHQFGMDMEKFNLNPTQNLPSIHSSSLEFCVLLPSLSYFLFLLVRTRLKVPFPVR